MTSRIFSPVAMLAVVAILVAVAAGQKYNTRYDNLDLDSILSNNRILTSYIRCILDKGPCTAEGREFKGDIPKALKNSCADCSDTQKTLVRKAAKFVMQNRPQDWDAIAKHFDPTGQQAESFQQFLNAV